MAAPRRTRSCPAVWSRGARRAYQESIERLTTRHPMDIQMKNLPHGRGKGGDRRADSPIATPMTKPNWAFFSTTSLISVPRWAAFSCTGKTGVWPDFCASTRGSGTRRRSNAAYCPPRGAGGIFRRLYDCAAEEIARYGIPRVILVTQKNFSQSNPFPPAFHAVLDSEEYRMTYRPGIAKLRVRARPGSRRA